MSNSSEYNQWRLISNGGIKYRFLGMTGNFDLNSGELTWKGMIRSSDFIAFATELFPDVTLVGSLAYQSAGTLPGWPNMIARRISFKSLDGEGGLPCDAVNSDPGAPIGTYHPFLELEIQFSTGNAKSPDPSDPRTFLEITSRNGGDFIYAPPGNTKLQDEINTLGEADENPEDPVFNEDGQLIGDRMALAKRPNRAPILPTIIRVPTTDWNIRWKSVPSNYYRNVLVHKLRYANGRVNGVSCPFLYNADYETLLLTGWDHTELWSWREGNLESPPLDIDIKINEKRVIWKGWIVGHNHVWDPGIGWVRAWIGENNTEPIYRHADFNFLFSL